MLDKTQIQKSKTPVYFWRPWYPPSTFSKLLLNLDKIFDERSIEKIIYNLESDLKDYFSCDYLVLTPSGSVALFLAGKTLLEKNDVLLPSLVCEVVPYAILQSGNSLNFLEINPATYNIDENDIFNKISSKRGAILAVHQFGLPCQMDVITDIAEDKNYLVIEDAAQSFGAEYKNQKVGTLGDIGIFSFNNKVIDASGGGLIVTNNQQYFQRMEEFAKSHYSIEFNKKKIIRNIIRSWLLSEFPRVGFAIGDFFKKELIPELTTKINPITPFLLQNIIPEIETILDCRQKNFNSYLSLLDDKKIIKPTWGGQITPSFTFCTIRFADIYTRDAIKFQLSKIGIRSEILAQPTHHRFNPKLNLPATELVADTMLSFPTDPHLDGKQILHITDTINLLLTQEPKFN